MSTLKINDDFKNVIYSLIDSRVQNSSAISTYINNLISSGISSKIKYDRLWSGSLNAGNNITIANAKNYDLLLFLVQSSWNRNGYIIISKWQLGQSKNFEVNLYSGSIIQNQVNPASGTQNVFTIAGDTSSKLTEVIGIKLS